MISISDLSTQEIEILKSKFDSFVKELKRLIEISKLFKDLTNENPSNSPNYHSFSNINDNNTGLIIQWWDNFSSINFRIRTKKIGNEWNFNLFSKDGIINRYEYDIFSYYPLYLYEGKHYDFYNYGKYENFINHFENGLLNISSDELKFISNVNDFIFNLFQDVKNEYNIIQNELSLQKDSLIRDLDTDSNGEVDLVDGESFNKLLTKNQKSIVEIDKNYIQKFVKISMYLKTKKSNTQKIFDSIKDTKNETELNELINLLKNQIHTYELLVFHSISMITSLVESDLITFYEIYECFDQLGVFNSNWENEVSNKLTDIGDGIKDLMYSIYQMENKIVNSIDNLTYVTQDSFRELNMSVNNQLSSIDSSIKFNNLLTGIQTYQMYKINQNTKRIN
jgi:hypothetical protein